jgi:hypothetical protein
MPEQHSRAEERYHLVCRECLVERLFDSADEATAAKLDHAAETGHRIAVERVK